MAQDVDPQTRADLQKVEYWNQVMDEARAELHIVIRGAAKRGASIEQLAEVLGVQPGGVQAMLDAPRQMPNGWLRKRLDREWE